jgi:hypothetical protein
MLVKIGELPSGLMVRMSTDQLVNDAGTVELGGAGQVSVAKR